MRQKSTSTKINVTYRIELETVESLEFLTRNPATGATLYGAKSLIVQKLLEGFLKARRTGDKTLDLSDILPIIN